MGGLLLGNDSGKWFITGKENIDNVDVNSLNAGVVEVGNFKTLTNSPFTSGWGVIVCFKAKNYGVLQIAYNHGNMTCGIRSGWDGEFKGWQSVSLT